MYDAHAGPLFCSRKPTVAFGCLRSLLIELNHLFFLFYHSSFLFVLQNKFRAWLFDLILQKKFEVFIMSVILTNMVTMMMEHHNQTDSFTNALNILSTN